MLNRPRPDCSGDCAPAMAAGGRASSLVHERREVIVQAPVIQRRNDVVAERPPLGPSYWSAAAAPSPTVPFARRPRIRRAMTIVRRPKPRAAVFETIRAGFSIDQP